MTDCICAIDPGLTGGIAFFFPGHPERVSVYDMPTVDGEVDITALADIITQMAPTVAVVEKVHGMSGGYERKMGAKTAFNFGGSYMAARAVITMAKVPMHLVTPAVWKKAVGLPGGPEGKEKARAMALRLFPACTDSFKRKKDHNRAEAALLARYGVRFTAADAA